MSMTAPETRAMWLLMLAEGGWWRADELIDRLALNPAKARDCLRRMRDGGTTLATRRNAAHEEFCVKPDCCVPAGITIDEVQQAIDPAAHAAQAAEVAARHGLSQAEAEFARGRVMQ